MSVDAPISGDPGFASGAELFFPNGYVFLNLIDEEPAAFKGGCAMSACGDANNGDFAWSKLA